MIPPPPPPPPPLPPRLDPPMAAPPMQAVHGQCFAFAMPAGWRVIEEGQFAVVLGAPGDVAHTLMVGNCGIPGYDPMRYLYEKLVGLGQQNVAMSAARAARPIAGFAGAQEVEFTCAADGLPWRGVASVHARPGYGTIDLVVTAARAQAAHWAQFAGWLPGVPAQFAVTNMAAWGAAGVAQQNLANSMALGRQWQEYQQWSTNLQQEVAADRARSFAMQSRETGEALTGQSWYDHPYGYPAQQLANTAAVHWAHRDGRVISSSDPNFDPRPPADPDWQRMARQGG